VYTGTIEGEEQANITAKLPERITAIKVKIGDAVSPGQLVAELDKAGASSQYYQAEAALENASRDLERMKALIKEGAISQQMLDGVQTQYTIAKANFEAVKSTVELTAPIQGIITHINGSVGDNASPMMPMMSVAKINSVKAVFMVGESDIVMCSTGKQVSITSEAKPGLNCYGSVVQISSSADEQSRSFEVKALFGNTSDRWFKPGMFCKVNMELQSRRGVIVVPSSAIIDRGSESFVFIAGDGIAVQKPVVKGISDGISTEIISGVNDGDALITTGLAGLTDRSPIKVQSR
jgi:RND family efflux transporter MFP subunit